MKALFLYLEGSRRRYSNDTVKPEIANVTHILIRRINMEGIGRDRGGGGVKGRAV